MNTTPSNSKLSTPFELPGTIDQDSTKQHARRPDVRSSLLPDDLDLNHRALNLNIHLDDRENPFTSEKDQEILDPKKQDVEIVDPKRDFPDKEFPEQEKEDEVQISEKIIPKEVEHFITNDEGDIIKEPTRELNDSYRPRHSNQGNIPAIEEEFPQPDPKENIETDF
jgi:hypothetical protein